MWNNIANFFKGKKAESKKINNNSILMDIVRNASGTDGAYWRNFSSRKPVEAKEIENLLKIDMKLLSDVDALEIVTTMLRWSANVSVPIKDLKTYILKSITDIIKDESINASNYTEIENSMLAVIKEKAQNEAKEFNISYKHTISNYIYEWVTESIKRDDYKTNKRPTYSASNIAPDIKHLNNKENKLIKLAIEGIDMISDNYKKLPKDGYIEALIYSTTKIITLPTYYNNNLDMDRVEDRYFLLLHDEISSRTRKINNIPAFINSRIKFYTTETQKLKSQSHYTPMFIYNAFYQNPLCEDPGSVNDFQVSPLDLMRFGMFLKSVNSFLSDCRNL